MNSLCHYCNNCIDTKNPCTKVKDKIMWCKDFILHDPLGKGNKSKDNKRLIDANKLIHEAETCIERTDMFQELIDKQPTINIQDIWPTAKWIYLYQNGFNNAIGYCSNCNIRTEKTNYCKKCGYKFKED